MKSSAKRFWIAVSTVGTFLIAAYMVFVSLEAKKYHKEDAKCLVTMESLRDALLAFHASYGHLPFEPSVRDIILSEDSAPSIAELGSILAGAEHAENPKALKFLEGKVSNAISDPWGRSFCVALDLNNDNQISAVGNEPTLSLRARVVIWSTTTKRKNSSGSRLIVSDGRKPKRTFSGF